MCKHCCFEIQSSPPPEPKNKNSKYTPADRTTALFEILDSPPEVCVDQLTSCLRKMYERRIREAQHAMEMRKLGSAHHNTSNVGVVRYGERACRRAIKTSTEMLGRNHTAIDKNVLHDVNDGTLEKLGAEAVRKNLTLETVSQIKDRIGLAEEINDLLRDTATGGDCFNMRLPVLVKRRVKKYMRTIRFYKEKIACCSIHSQIRSK